MERWVLWLVLGIGTLVMVAPFYWMIITSFKPRSEVLLFPPTWWPQQPTLDPWRTLANLRGGFSVFFRNSLYIATTVTALVLLTSALSAYVFAKFEFRGRNALFVLLLSMMMIPFNVSIIPLYKLMADLNWTNTHWALIIPSAYLDNVTLDICAKTRGVPGPSREHQHGGRSLSQADSPPTKAARPEATGQNRPAKRCVWRTCV